MRYIPLLGIVFILFGNVSVNAQQEQQDRRGRTEPGLIVETGGRMGTCDMLTFSPDGRFLLAVGDDKVVRIWPVGPKGIDAKGVRALRWSIWHEQRGNIYAMALDPPGRRVAIGGKGVITGMVMVLDFQTGKVLQALTDVKNNDQVIRFVVFSPSGDQLAFGAEDGSVWLWNLASDRDNDVRRLGPGSKDKSFNSVRLLVFEKENQLVSVGWDGRVLEWNLEQPMAEPRFRFRFFDNEDGKADLYRVVLSADGKWLAAAGWHPSVQIRSLDGKERKNDIVLSGRRAFPVRVARSLAFDATSQRLAVGIRTIDSNDFFHGTNDEVTVFDLAKGQTSAGPPCSYHAEGLAFHPEGTLLALAGGDNHEVTLWNTVTREKVGPEGRGPGNCLWGVGLSSNSRYLGFLDRRAADPDANHRGSGPWTVFDLNRHKWLATPQDFKPVKPVESIDGWRVSFPKKNVFQWSLVGPDERQWPLNFEENTGGKPLCYTFLKAVGDKPLRLAVGQYFGAISIFELNADKPRHLEAMSDGVEQAVPARLLTAHQGEVMALAPSADHKWLVSASRDQTIAGCNLGDGPTKTELGATFKHADGKLLVDAVDAGDPAWEAGLIKGDEVRLLAYSGRLEFDAAKGKGDIKSTMQLLGRARPGRELYFVLKRPGQPNLIHTPTTIRRRPQWRFFPTRDKEWVLWLWRSYYYDTSTNGDYLIGWHVNKGKMLDRQPDFYKAEKMRQAYQRPDLVDQLLWDAKAETTLPSLVRIRPPHVMISLVYRDKKPSDDVVEVTLQADAYDKDNPDQQLKRAELWIEDYRYASWPGAGKNFTKTISIPRSALRSGANQLTFQCYNEAGSNDEATLPLQQGNRTDRPNLFGLVVGIGNYQNARVPGGRPPVDLKYTTADARAMRDAWSKQVGKRYQHGSLELLPDEQATREAILGHLKKLVGKVQPDDLLLVFLAGHGYDQSREQPGKNRFVFCTPTFDIARPEETGITSQALYEALAVLPCRKLVLLDVCHAGLAANPVRDLTPGGKGPIILASCDKTESAVEDDTYKHGLFTYALIEALGTAFDKADKNKDGKLDADELFAYAEGRVPELLKTVKREEGQNPTRFPLSPEPAPLAEK
jgi:WD40 repeat protein